MFLKRVDIKGFKSFATATAFDFARTGLTKGMTAIVGPNGSGKSNLSDAVRWVMGEQSMKTLRGKKSEDVIFAGSETRPRASMAEVSLVFDNADKSIPLEFDEVVITRKLYRSGESDYLVNGAAVRLLDVVDLLAQMGIGRESYSVVGQGMADAILSASPIERREMIEDAAGVKHYQIRKARALKKLDRTKENLAQVDALIAEVTPHIRSLKRQATKARQSKEIYEQYKTAQRTYFTHVWQTLMGEKTALDDQAATVGVAFQHAQRDVDRVNDQLMAEAKKVDDANQIADFEKTKRTTYALLQDLEKKIAIAAGRIDLQKERKAHEKKVIHVPVDLAYVQKELDVIRARQAELIDALEEVSDVACVQEIAAQLRDVHAQMDRLYNDAGKKHVDVATDDYDERIAAYDATIAQLEKDVAQHTGAAQDAQATIARLDDEIAAVVAADKAARITFFALEKEKRDKQIILDDIREKLNAVRVDMARVDVRIDDVRGEVREELGVEVEDLAVTVEHASPEQIAHMEQEVRKLRSKYEHVGGIDPLVIDEYEEMQARFDVLITESRDLANAIVQLKEVVKEMDDKIHTAFTVAFKEINEEFSKYFRILFNGGTAKLKKTTIAPTLRRGDGAVAEEDTSSDDVVADATSAAKPEIGIDIIASPPGKKVSHLSLLSGGERSLTSVAMLLAIIAYNPPPFTILDEVEAALDEANSRRLARIFSELTDKTQFIVITHNRETMRHADVLYGVTMGDDGVSQLLSVTLDQVKDDDGDGEIDEIV